MVPHARFVNISLIFSLSTSNITSLPTSSTSRYPSEERQGARYSSPSVRFIPSQPYSPIYEVVVLAAVVGTTAWARTQAGTAVRARTQAGTTVQAWIHHDYYFMSHVNSFIAAFAACQMHNNRIKKKVEKKWLKPTMSRDQRRAAAEI